MTGELCIIRQRESESKGSHQIKQNSIKSYMIAISDEFELKFPKLSQAELKGFRAESSQAGAFQFSS